jgi:DNA mismatch repair protein MutS2
MNDEVFEVPPSNSLDLHHFKPNEVKVLIDEFIWSCQQAGIREAEIIHGKGTGSLRELSHLVLKKHTKVKSFQLGGAEISQNWGKTSFVLID